MALSAGDAWTHTSMGAGGALAGNVFRHASPVWFKPASPCRGTPVVGFEGHHDTATTTSVAALIMASSPRPGQFPQMIQSHPAQMTGFHACCDRDEQGRTKVSRQILAHPPRRYDARIPHDSESC